jgi:hypothetical protein
MAHPVAGRIFAVVTAVFIAGCAGHNFVRPSDGAFTLGQTPYAQVVQQLGEPRRESTMLRNGKQIQVASYSYATNFDEPLEAGVVPARALSYYFADGVLVGQEFISSFKSDNTNFDAANVSAIAKGTTDRTEVMRLFGKPTATYIYPMIKDSPGQGIGYIYASTVRSGPFSVKFTRKVLRVSFDASDRVSDVEFAQSQ